MRIFTRAQKSALLHGLTLEHHRLEFIYPRANRVAVMFQPLQKSVVAHSDLVLRNILEAGLLHRPAQRLRIVEKLVSPSPKEVVNDLSRLGKWLRGKLKRFNSPVQVILGGRTFVGSKRKHGLQVGSSNANYAGRF